MANRKHPTKGIGRDTMNGTAESIPPSDMVGSALLDSSLRLEYQVHEKMSHQIAVTDMEGDYSSAGETADYRHWECGVPLKRCYRGDIYHLLHNLPGVRGSHENNATLTTASKVITVWGETDSCNRAHVSGERFSVRKLSRKHRAWKEGRSREGDFTPTRGGNLEKKKKCRQKQILIKKINLHEAYACPVTEALKKL